MTPIKPNDPSKIPLCVDMRVANEAILRTGHVTPTLDDIIHDLNGTTRFSKFDFALAFHQLELHPESRAICNFSTHIGLFRYKRLFFGISSASEVFQYTVSQVLRGLPASEMSICLSVSLSVCRQNAKKNAIFSKTKQFRAVSINYLSEVM